MEGRELAAAGVSRHNTADKVVGALVLGGTVAVVPGLTQ
jgi:formate dehydrogenase assembly factor FdhD